MDPPFPVPDRELPLRVPPAPTRHLLPRLARITAPEAPHVPSASLGLSLFLSFFPFKKMERKVRETGL